MKTENHIKIKLAGYSCEFCVPLCIYKYKYPLLLNKFSRRHKEI